MLVGFNELSLAGQVRPEGEQEVLAFMLSCREETRSAGGTLKTLRRILAQRFIGEATLAQRLHAMPDGEPRKRLLLSWLANDGPFVDDDQGHDSSIWFELPDGAVVTDATLAELAHVALQGLQATAAVSLVGGGFDSNPLVVTRVDGDNSRTPAPLANFGDLVPFRTWLQAQEGPMRSWADLAARAQRVCSSLLWAADAFAPLASQPFQPGVAMRLLERLSILQRMKTAFDDHGDRTPEGDQLYQTHFTGEKAWFSDSSTSEKAKFEQELTFRHPQTGASVFCPWHGKLNTPPYRVHFTYPINVEAPLVVVYVGPKRTKR